MPAVEIDHVVKSYADKVAVNDLSFTVEHNEIFGLIGPNGAGKTTTIRMMMDILKPDSGDIMLFGEKLSEAMKSRIGYLPEERGLYKKLSVMESIVYLASLKGMDARSATASAKRLLKQTGMSREAYSKIEELSKGMGQIIQFIVTIVHDPELVIMDEPFTSLDPVNTELIRNMLLDLRNKGKVVILSTHQMNQVQELCDRVLMIDQGRSVLYGNLAEIRSKYRGDSVFVDAQGELGQIPGVVEKKDHKEYVELVLDGKSTPQQILERLVKAGVIINTFEVGTPSLNDIFLKVVGDHDE